MREVAREEADLILENASELLTLEGGTKKPLIGKRSRDLGLVKDGSIAISRGRVVAVGTTAKIRERFESRKIIDANKKVVMPGFVDPHTHLVFAGSREDEFEMRLEGTSYMEILLKDGGRPEKRARRGCLKAVGRR